MMIKERTQDINKNEPFEEKILRFLDNFCCLLVSKNIFI